MVRLGLGISGRAHGLEPGFSQRGLVGRESAHACRAAGREKNCSDCGEGDNDGEPSVFQGGFGVINRLFTSHATEISVVNGGGRLCSLLGSRKIAACSPNLISNSRRRLMKSKRKVFTKPSGLSRRRRTHTLPSPAASAFSIYAQTITSAW